MRSYQPGVVMSGTQTEHSPRPVAAAQPDTSRPRSSLTLGPALATDLHTCRLDGIERVARRFVDLPPQRLAGVASIRDPSLVPVLAVVPDDDCSWLVSATPPGASLRRLLRFAGLSPDQAALVAIDVERALDRLASAGYPIAVPDAKTVRITTTGTAVLSDWAAAVLSEPAVRAGSGRATDSVIELLADAIGTPPAGEHTDPEAAIRAAMSVADADAGADRSATRAGLGALVATWRGRRARTVRAADASAGTGGPGPASGPSRRRTSRFVRAAGRRSWRLLAAVVVLALVVGFEATSLRGQLIDDLHLLLGDSPTSQQGTDHKPSHAPPTVAPPAPGAAGRVIGVTLRSEQTCRPGAQCPIAVSVRLKPAKKATTVRWSLRVVDRCTGKHKVRGSGTVRVHRGAKRMVVERHVRLPKSRALSVFAVTKKPARASSDPLLAPTKASCKG